MIEYIEDQLDPRTYKYLREHAGFHNFSLEQATGALKNSLKIIVACDDDTQKVVGMGRLVGDGYVANYIQDIIIDSNYRGQDIGTTIVNKLLDYTINLTEPGTTMMLGLMCVKGTESFYEKMGFTLRPNGRFGPGFSRYIKKNEDGTIDEC